MPQDHVPSPAGQRFDRRWGRRVWAARQRLQAWLFALQLARQDLYHVTDGPLRWGETLLVLAGLGTLVGKYGFWLTSAALARLHTLQTAFVWGCLALFLLRVGLTTHRWTYLKQHRLQSLLMGLVLLDFLLYHTSLARFWPWGGGVQPHAVLHRPLFQGVIVLLALEQGGHASRMLATWQLRPAQTLVLSFLALIAVGTLLLMLPRATTQPGSLPLLQALFTATSAVCVTGLIVVDTATAFTPLGQGILLGLFQLGGLGIITFATLFGMMIHGRIGMREKLLLQDFMPGQHLSELGITVRRIVGLTFLIEALGAASLYYSWRQIFPEALPRLWHAIFHAVSAFCNAGFSTFATNLAAPAVATQPGGTMTVMLLIILGGIGFSTLWESLLWVTGAMRGHRPRLSVQSRLVWMTTGVLIAVGTGVFVLLEARGVLGAHQGGTRFLGALFQAVTARTAGFNTLPIHALAVPTAFLLIILMVIGASPGSTGGGVKTTTIAVLVLTTVATIRGKTHVEVFRRTLPWPVIDQAYATFFFAIAVITSSLFLLTLTESQPFLDLFFEEVSAFATVGLSRGITAALTDVGKGVIIVSMFVGRVGSLTLAMALAQQVKTTAYEYPAEAVMVG